MNIDKSIDSNGFSFLLLPAELHLHICSFLSLTDQKTVALTCKYLCSLVYSSTDNATLGNLRVRAYLLGGLIEKINTDSSHSYSFKSSDALIHQVIPSPKGKFFFNICDPQEKFTQSFHCFDTKKPDAILNVGPKDLHEQCPLLSDIYRVHWLKENLLASDNHHTELLSMESTGLRKVNSYTDSFRSFFADKTFVFGDRIYEGKQSIIFKDQKIGRLETTLLDLENNSFQTLESDLSLSLTPEFIISEAGYTCVFYFPKNQEPTTQTLLIFSNNGALLHTLSLDFPISYILNSVRGYGKIILYNGYLAYIIHLSQGSIDIIKPFNENYNLPSSTLSIQKEYFVIFSPQSYFVYHFCDKRQIIVNGTFSPQFFSHFSLQHALNQQASNGKIATIQIIKGKKFLKFTQAGRGHTSITVPLSNNPHLKLFETCALYFKIQRTAISLLLFSETELKYYEVKLEELPKDDFSPLTPWINLIRYSLENEEFKSAFKILKTLPIRDINQLSEIFGIEQAYNFWERSLIEDEIFFVYHSSERHLFSSNISETGKYDEDAIESIKDWENSLIYYPQVLEAKKLFDLGEVHKVLTILEKLPYPRFNNQIIAAMSLECARKGHLTEALHIAKQLKEEERDIFNVFPLKELSHLQLFKPLLDSPLSSISFSFKEEILFEKRMLKNVNDEQSTAPFSASYSSQNFLPISQKILSKSISLSSLQVSSFALKANILFEKRLLKSFGMDDPPHTPQELERKIYLVSQKQLKNLFNLTKNKIKAIIEEFDNATNSFNNALDFIFDLPEETKLQNQHKASCFAYLAKRALYNKDLEEAVELIAFIPKDLEDWRIENLESPIRSLFSVTLSELYDIAFALKGPTAQRVFLTLMSRHPV